MATTEKELEKNFCNELKKNGIKTIKGSSKNNKGFPDRIVFAKSGIYFVELKNDTYYGQTKLQKYWEQIITQSGGEYYLLNGETETKEFIKKITQSEN